MKIGIIGLPQSGKTTLFEALTHSGGDLSGKMENRLATIHVPDARIDTLSDMYEPKKTTWARIEYFLPGMQNRQKEKDGAWSLVRDCDALVHVIRNFAYSDEDRPDPLNDFVKLDQELIFADLMVVEKRLEKIDLERKRHRPVDEEELSLLQSCRELLEAEKPIRSVPQLASSPLLRGYAFLSGRPMLILFNNPEESMDLPALSGPLAHENVLAIRGKLEHEISRMAEEDAQSFMEAYHIEESARDRVIGECYRLLGLISFFTVGKDEVRAWTIRKGTQAVDAAAEIHSDIQKGFIRAETIAYDDLMAAGSMAEARKRGTVRLEGKTYAVQDGDIIEFRFNV